MKDEQQPDLTTIVRGIIDRVVTKHGNEVWLGDGYNADETLAEAITEVVQGFVRELAELRERDRTISRQIERRADGMDPLTVSYRAERDAAEVRAKAAEQREQALRDELCELVEIVDTIRNGSPNQFYARIDALAKRSRALLTAPAGPQEPKS